MKVVAYHGTSEAAVQALERGATWIPSENVGDWLGTGVYFFEGGPGRAYSWAQSRAKSTKPAVIRAEIDLTDAIDLFDVWGWQALRRNLAAFQRVGSSPTQGAFPLQTNGEIHDGDVESLIDRNKLDKAYVDFCVKALKKRGWTITGVRAAFMWGRPPMNTSFLHDWSHAQIAVRDPTIIRDWHALPADQIEELRRIAARQGDGPEAAA